MGYDVRLVRRGFTGRLRPIRREEWEQYAAKDGTFGAPADATVKWLEHDAHPPFWFDDGEIVVKNPDDRIVRKMVDVAHGLGCHVEGDDGERYDIIDGEIVHSDPPVPIATRIRGLLRNRRSGAGDENRGAPLDLVDGAIEPVVGEVYQDLLGDRVCRVVSVDPEADYGLGWVVIRYEDGQERKRTRVSSGLQPLE